MSKSKDFVAQCLGHQHKLSRRDKGSYWSPEFNCKGCSKFCKTLGSYVQSCKSCNYNVCCPCTSKAQGMKEERDKLEKLRLKDAKKAEKMEKEQAAEEARMQAEYEEAFEIMEAEKAVAKAAFDRLEVVKGLTYFMQELQLDQEHMEKAAEFTTKEKTKTLNEFYREWEMFADYTGEFNQYEALTRTEARRMEEEGEECISKALVRLSMDQD